MSDVPSNTAPKPIEGDLRLVASLVYGLFLFSFFTHGLTALVGAVIAYVKRPDARGTIFESHFSNAITVFWVSVVFAILFTVAVIAGIAGMFSLFGPGFWHWHAHDWTAHMHAWQWQADGPAVPQSWWPLVGFLPVVPLGFLLYVVWYLYRVIRGLIHALDNKPY
ncbi:MAG TPA: hypothetical protein VHL34_15900 [Rhizomicrobium sp.]|jgi:uncharacterized membrane protein|nr:hypothetical protein [Rhizomicrobium sp.]